MSIDTRVEGNPDSIRTVASWLRDTLAPALSEGVDELYRARNTAQSGWEGAAGDGFASRAGSSAAKAEDLVDAVTSYAQEFEDTAAELQQTHDRMREIRETASEAGLRISGDVIEEPGPAPADPGAPPAGTAATAVAIESYNLAVIAFDRYAELVRAYEAAQRDAEAEREDWAFALQTLTNVWSTVTGKWFFVAADLVNGAAGYLAGRHVAALTEQAKFLSQEADKFLELARTAPEGSPASLVYRDLDLSRALKEGAEEAAASALKSEATSGRIGLRVGGALSVASVAYDIYDGKPVEQAVVSGAAGFGASLAAGAAAGAVVGSAVPGLGTAVGAVVGLGAGLFASGAVDSLYQNGGDVSDAIGAGFDAVGDAGTAVGGLAKDAWDAVF
ncbi:WXG100 family type VII secretion target [Rhodococcus spongiicola]|uniref:WXG100 family type VII secretion target n=1 Tax=Rhodococcus spongiicola TaxID=2487352 RepID=A0A3S3AAX5_9NOCA|nr:WXG100 family type VII secretion target [Rhodococcus spongiicola]RVW05984.1 hypothetical protein EF834_00415 [Rhodococcus spongiicola]